MIGRLVTGWNREGLIATHFTISGPFDDVDVGLVPLSTVTPGILRDVLGMSGGGGDEEIEDSAEEKTDDGAGDEGAEPPETGRNSRGPE